MEQMETMTCNKVIWPCFSGNPFVFDSIGAIAFTCFVLARRTRLSMHRQVPEKGHLYAPWHVVPEMGTTCNLEQIDYFTLIVTFAVTVFAL